MLTNTERAERAKVTMRKATRPVWLGDDGWLRIGRGDMRQMLEDLGYPTSAQ